MFMLPAIRKNISAITIPQNQLDSAIEANQYALNHYALAIAGRLCSIDGDLNINEKKSFLGLFPYFGQEHLSLLKETANDEASVYINCKRFNKFANDNTKISAQLYAKLFKLSYADGNLNLMEISYLEKIAVMLGLSKTLLEKGLEYYFLKDLDKEKKFTAYIDAKNYYRREILKLHPDHFYGTEIVSSRIKNKLIDIANQRVKILNEHYRNSLA